MESQVCVTRRKLLKKTRLNLFALPIHGLGEIALVNKETGTYETVSLTRMNQLAREAHEEERPVWIVIGEPRSKPKRKLSDKKAT